MFNERRVRIIAGHYGSGKTEFAVNYTLGLLLPGKDSYSRFGHSKSYFRSREIEPLFVEKV